MLIDVSKWVILKMTHRDIVLFKVLYSTGNDWRLSGSISEVESLNDHYIINDCRCHKDNYGMNIPMIDILVTMVRTHRGAVTLLENTNWEEMEWK